MIIYFIWLWNNNVHNIQDIVRKKLCSKDQNIFEECQYPQM